MFIIATFYHFFDFAGFEQARTPLLATMRELGIKGSLLIAPEGFNGTLAGTRQAIDAMLSHLRGYGEFTHKESQHDRQPFGRAKVRLKKETISLGEPTPSLISQAPSPALPRDAGEGEESPLSPKGGGLGRGPADGGRGIYVEPQDWNALIARPDTYILDTRNTYEVHLGTFEGAVDPGIRNFKELPAFVRKTLDPAVHKHIATFCTGGIRCEKFTAWLKQEGFENVYHLKGGILKYLEETPPAASRWEGECYVFDERVAVGHGLVPSSTATMCPACGHALTVEDRQHPQYIDRVSCPYCG